MSKQAPRNATALQAAQAYLETLGVQNSAHHAKEMLARIQGYANGRAMDLDTAFESPSTLMAKASGKFTLVSPSPGGAWISVENVSVHVSKGAEGVEVNLFAKGCHHEPLGEAELSYAQATAAQEEFFSEAEMSSLDFCLVQDDADWEKAHIEDALRTLPVIRLRAARTVPRYCCPQ